MKLPFSAALLVCALACGPAQAQIRPFATAAQYGSVQQAAVARPFASTQVQDVDPNTLVRGAVQMLGLVDANRAGELWNGGSAAAKQASTRETFVAQVKRNRQGLGAPVQRAWMNVRRQEMLAGQAGRVPPGIYATIEFSTVFASRKAMLEMVSLRLEPDGRWHFAGYAIKP